MQTLDLWPAAVHKYDPASSFRAEKRITESGRRQTHYDRVLSALKSRPDSTAAELAQFLGIPILDVVEVRRRLNDALRKSDAVQGEIRKCRIAQTAAVTWRAKA